MSTIAMARWFCFFGYKYKSYNADKYTIYSYIYTSIYFRSISWVSSTTIRYFYLLTIISYLIKTRPQLCMLLSTIFQLSLVTFVGVLFGIGLGALLRTFNLTWTESSFGLVALPGAFFHDPSTLKLLMQEIFTQGCWGWLSFHLSSPSLYLQSSL